jgi:signal transduction histidine kinase
MKLDILFFVFNTVLGLTIFAFLAFEQHKQQLQKYVAAALLFFVLDNLIHLITQFPGINTGLLAYVRLACQVVFLAILMLIYQASFASDNPKRKKYGYYITGIFTAVALGLVFGKITYFYDDIQPDIVVYFILPALFLIGLSLLSFATNTGESERAVHFRRNPANWLLPPLLLGYVLFVHIAWPLILYPFAIAIFLNLFIGVFLLWMLRSNLLVISPHLSRLFVAYSVLLPTFILLHVVLPVPDHLKVPAIAIFEFAVFIIIPAVVVLIVYGGEIITGRFAGNVMAKKYTVDRFIQQMFRHLSWDKFGQYVVNHLYHRFGANRIAFIIRGKDEEPYRVFGNINFPDKNLTQILQNKEIDWYKYLNKYPSGLYPELLNRKSVIYSAMINYHIGAVLPVRDASEFLGMLFISDEKFMPVFTNEEQDELQLLTSQIALAMEQLQMTEKYYQNEKMAEIGSFASQLAHDFRSFISIIQLAPESTPFLKKLARQTGDMIQDLLTFVRPGELKLMPTNFNDLIDGSILMINVPKEIEIVRQLDDNLPEVAVDINQMRRVFTNLINNAVRAVMAKDGGRIKITTRKLRTFNIFAESEWLYVEILDEGEGIKESDLGKIFQPFFTRHKESGGSGLGLSIVKKILEAHGAVIDVTSASGKGTAFNIRIPLQASMMVR